MVNTFFAAREMTSCQVETKTGDQHVSRASREIGDSGERHQPRRSILVRWTEGVKVMELIRFTLWEDIRSWEKVLEGR